MTDPSYKLSDFSVLGVDPPSPMRGPQTGFTFFGDTARFLVEPDTNFERPWLATPPSGSAFVFPIGIQGFNLASTAELGVHKYIGDNDVDVNVVYPDEQHITLSGTLPGKTSPVNMRALRTVILEPTIDAGKVLMLPLLEQVLIYVNILNYSFTHAETDNTNSIAYSIEMIRTGSGRKIVIPQVQQPSQNPTLAFATADRGDSANTVTTPSSEPTLRSLAASVTGNPDDYGGLIDLNASTIEDVDGIPAYKLAFAPIPMGTEISLD